MKVKEAIATYRVPRKTYTYQDYFEMPDDGKRYEIIDGELIELQTPYIIHQTVSGNILFELVKFVNQKKVGTIYMAPLDVVFNDINVVQPDILFIATENYHIITEKNISGVPDLIIEIISPATGYYDLSGKKDLYEKFGVQEYWIVDPMKQRIEIYLNFEHKFELHQRLEKKGIVKSNILKGFEIDLETIFGLD
jgi:Uma2 family endonuclease